VLLAEELNGLPGESKQEKASDSETGAAGEDATPIDGIWKKRA
jgi:hypothetical protein